MGADTGRDIDEQFDRWSLVLDDVRLHGELALVSATVTARGRASAVTLEFPAPSVWRFAADGRVSRVRIYTDADEAFAALGAPQ